MEDKVVVAQDIAATLGDLGYEIAGMVDSGEKAIAVVKKQEPDLILMDINLKGKIDGIDAANTINQVCPTPIIYLTAYSDKVTLERAKHTHPYAYIVKPFDEKDLQIAVDLAIHNFANQNNAKKAENGQSYYIKNSLFIKKDSRYQKLLIDHVLYVEANGSYIEIITVDKKYTLAINLLHFENQITHKSLMRVHRSFIINLNQVTSFDHSQVFIGEKEIPISSTYRDQFHKRFQYL